MKRTIIFIEGVRVFAKHGVLKEEKEREQEFLIDAEVEADAESAHGTDSLSDTVDYAAIAAVIANEAKNTSFDLIETLASRIVDRILAMKRVISAEVTVRKPGAPLGIEFRSVGVRVRAYRE